MPRPTIDCACPASAGRRSATSPQQPDTGGAPDGLAVARRWSRRVAAAAGALIAVIALGNGDDEQPAKVRTKVQTVTTKPEPTTPEPAPLSGAALASVAERPGQVADRRGQLRGGDPDPAAGGGCVPGRHRPTSTTPTPCSTSARRCASPAGPRRRSRSSSSGSRSPTSRGSLQTSSRRPSRMPGQTSSGGVQPGQGEEELVGRNQARQGPEAGQGP